MATAVQPTWDYWAQPKDRLTACNLCGNTLFVVLSDHDRYGLPQETHGCLTCGLVFLNPLMTREAYAEFYEQGIYRMLLSKYRPDTPGTLEKSQQLYAMNLCDFLRPFVGNGGTLLDVGGASGITAGIVASQFKKQPFILEPSGEKQASNIIKGMLEDWDDDRTFDLVLLCQTIDHLHDLMGGLRKVRKMLTPKGLFYVDILDLRMMVKAAKGLRGALKVDHPYYLTEETAELALAMAGFRVLRKTYATMPRHVGYLCDAPFGDGRLGSVVAPWPDAKAILREVRE